MVKGKIEAASMTGKKVVGLETENLVDLVGTERMVEAEVSAKERVASVAGGATHRIEGLGEANTGNIP